MFHRHGNTGGVVPTSKVACAAFRQRWTARSALSAAPGGGSLWVQKMGISWVSTGNMMKTYAILSIYVYIYMYISHHESSTFIVFKCIQWEYNDGYLMGI